MSDRVILDSTVLIDALRGYPAADRIRSMRRSKVQFWVSPISIEEIWRGLRPAEQTRAARLIDALRLAPIDRRVAKTAGSWRRDYAISGSSLHQADCLIASSAKYIGARLATGNPSDFPMDEIIVEHWPVGE
ncbi:MAG: PIN domain-containing protein [Actinomycetia bacterium]|nr:PIN domain-containing protein [Actinomycetes bacterium]